MARYSLFVLKLPLTSNQPTDQPCTHRHIEAVVTGLGLDLIFMSFFLN